jgi:addiction module HigA family antidote
LPTIWNSFAEDDMPASAARKQATSATHAVRDAPDVNLDNLDSFLGDGHVKPLHPGVIYRGWVIDRRGLHVTDVAAQAGISREMLHRILRGDATVTAKTAIGLAKVARNEPEFWLRAQAVYDLWSEREKQKKPARAAQRQLARS